jgi:hypothetical protein
LGLWQTFQRNSPQNIFLEILGDGQKIFRQKFSTRVSRRLSQAGLAPWNSEGREQGAARGPGAALAVLVMGGSALVEKLIDWGQALIGKQP